MRRCHECLMAESKPGVELDEDGVCPACRRAADRSGVDYDDRFNQLEALAEKYRRKDGQYDCIIPVSGGKDSYYQTHVMAEELEMNPLLVAVKDSYSRTAAGEHNIRNLREQFNCDLITVEMGIETERKMTRAAFEGELGYPIWATERAIQCVPLQMAINFDIPFIIYGENVSWEYGGVLEADEEPYSAMSMVENNVAEPVEMEYWLDYGLSAEELNMIEYPSIDEIESSQLEPVFLSYFQPWDGYDNYQLAKRYGFRDLSGEWDRAGYIDDFDQIDTIGYLINYFLKYVKLGFGRTTDVVGYWRRSDHFDLSRSEARALIEANDHKLDQTILDDFLEFAGYTDREFWEIVEEHKNDELFEGSFLSGPIPKPENDFENFD
ncbi:N-acetyl sugar amidotransferase [Halovivax limisalsi]|uniref:N-acetyl sugar amidotransferase n=1 Tax=Halovivax limisalsi TaxID=1453760 RepID=UPI00249423CE|nr:N-acetyl sugar amidotransferase [Halovivax limisalsi]